MKGARIVVIFEKNKKNLNSVVFCFNNPFFGRRTTQVVLLGISASVPSM